MATVLVVDDHSLNRRFLAALLGFANHTLLEANDGIDALALAHRYLPDLVITDILMPNMDGIEFVQRLREAPELMGIPVIFYTASYSAPQANSMARTCGVRWILQKPSSPESIMAAVNDALGLPQAQAEPRSPPAIRSPERFVNIDRQLTQYVHELDSGGTSAPELARTHAQALADLQTVGMRLTALIDLGIELASERDPERMVDKACGIARHIAAARYAAIGLLDGHGGAPRWIALRGFGPDAAGRLRACDPRAGVFGAVLATREPRNLASADGTPIEAGLPTGNLPMRSLLVAPVVSSARVHGWVCLGDKLLAERFSDVDVEAVVAVGAQLGIAYENLELYDRLERNLARMEAQARERELMTVQVAQSETQLRQLAENIRGVFFLNDVVNGGSLYISPAYEQVWGRSCASLYERPDSWIDAVHPDDLERMRAEAASQRGTEVAAFDHRYRILRPDGEVRWIHARGFPIRDAAGQVYRIAGIAEDITAQRQTDEALRESERRYRDMLDNVDLVSVMIDLDGRVSYCNDYFLTLTGWDREQVLGRAWVDTFIAPDDSAEIESVRATLLQGERYARHYQNTILTRAGERRLIQWNNSVLHAPDGAIVGTASIGEDITEQASLRQALREREAGLQRAQLVSKLAHVVSDFGGNVVGRSATLPALLGVDEAALPLHTRDWIAVLHPADREPFRACSIDAARSGEHREIDYRMLHGAGHWIHIHHVFEPLGETPASGRGARWFNTIQDVSEQHEQQQKIARLSRIYAMQSGINSAIVRIHDRTQLLYQACRVAVADGGFGMAWVGIVEGTGGRIRIGRWHGDVTHGLQHDAGTPDELARVAARERHAVVCNDLRAEADDWVHGARWLDQGHGSMAALPLMAGRDCVAVIVVSAGEPNFFDKEEVALLGELAADLSFGLQFIAKEERLSYLSFYDVMTGLPNRALFMDRLAQMLGGHDGAPAMVAVIVIDLDRFSQLNDVLGRHAGDTILTMVGARLTASLQANMKDAHGLARIGDDTFAVALDNLQHGADAATLAERHLLDALDQPFVIDRQEVRLTTRAGLALYPHDGANADTLLKHADLALKKAKGSAARFMYYAPQMNAAIAVRISMESALRVALAERQFQVHYQPRVDLATGQIVSAEALIRWFHPERGAIAPVDFIGLAEETGLIVPIGSWVIDAVCAQQAAWQAAGIDIVPVAVNLSAVQFRKGDLLETIGAALERHALAQKYLEFELTESAVMEEPEQAKTKLLALKALGAKLSLDDFGTGYSSLAYLQQFPFDFVKIDRAFVTNLSTNPGDAAIVTAVIAMAHSLNLRVVAEGVETEGQLRYLRSRACDEVQGFLFSMPVAAAEFAAMLAAGRRLWLEQSAERELDCLLIVDDEPCNLMSLQRMLRFEGYRVLSADSARAGLELLALNKVQVIVSDQRMPKMSGSEFFAIVKDLYPDTIRIILSAYADIEAVTDAVNHGAVFKFLTKPWNDDLLKGHIRDAFRRYQPGAVRALKA